MKTASAILVATFLVAGYLVVFSANAADAKESKEVKVQTACPVLGGEIDKKLFVDFGGKRIYVCCAGCIAAVKANPQKYIKELEAKGIVLDKAK